MLLCAGVLYSGVHTGPLCRAPSQPPRYLSNVHTYISHQANGIILPHCLTLYREAQLVFCQILFKITFNEYILLEFLI